jgi:hypothetical protein
MATAGMGLSTRKYAAHRRALGLPGASATSVTKALKEGRIARNAAGKIDAAQADLDWHRNTDPARGGTRTVPAENRSNGGHPPPGGTNPNGAKTRNDARAIHDTIKAKMAQLDLEERAGNLVQRQAAEAAAFDQARQLRDAVLAIPDRLDSLLAAEDNPREVHRILLDNLEAALGAPAAGAA